MTAVFATTFEAQLASVSCVRNSCPVSDGLRPKKEQIEKLPLRVTSEIQRCTPMTDGLAGKLPVAVERGSSPVANHVAGYLALATKICDTEKRHAAGLRVSVARFRSYATATAPDSGLWGAANSARSIVESIG
jgi:hypothetical protein